MLISDYLLKPDRTIDTMQLSEYFDTVEIKSDGEFLTLGRSDSSCDGTLAYCENIHNLRRAEANPAVSCLITTEELSNEVTATKGIILSNSPRNTYYELHQHLIDNNLLEPKMEFGVGDGCNIDSSAIISPMSRIGDGVVIGANVVVGKHVIIGNNSFIDSGVHVGVEGILYWCDKDGNKLHVRHQGGVVIGHHAALLCNAVIVKSVHRGLFTAVGNHSIIGIASNIGHEAEVGDNVVVSNNCVVARGASIKSQGFIGTTVVVREYVTIGERAQVKSGSVVVRDVPENQVVSGNFARNHRQNVTDYLTAVGRWQKSRS